MAYRMSNGSKSSVGFGLNGSRRGCDSDVDPFIFLRVRYHQIHSIVGIPCGVLEIQNSRVGEVQPERILAKGPPGEVVHQLRPVSKLRQTNVELALGV